VQASSKASRTAPKPSAAAAAAWDGARIIAIANQKGGVGKSTTAVSLGAALAELGHRVLVVDLDPQGNASTGLGIRHEEREVTVYDVLAAEAPIQGAIVPTPIDNLFAIPSTIDLAGAEIELVSQFSREMRLRKAIEPLRDGAFDFVFLDCPPSLGLLTVNALAAAEELIVPIQCEYYALEGLGQLLRNVRLVQQNVNTSLRLTGIVMTMFDPRTKLSEQVVAEVRRFFGDRVYQTIIPRTVRLSEAPGFGQPITAYDPNSKGAQSYRDLAREVAARLPDESPLPSVEEVPSVVIQPPEPQAARAPRPLVRPDDLEEPAAEDLTATGGVPEGVETPQARPHVETPTPAPAVPEGPLETPAPEHEADMEGTGADEPLPGPEPEPTEAEAGLQPDPNADETAPGHEAAASEVSAPGPNGDADVAGSVEQASRHDDPAGTVGNGDRSQPEPEEPAASGSGKRRRRFFRRGGS
jgi:chromosome partitioning protein